MNQTIKRNIKNCKKCELHKTCTNPVIGSGNNNAEILFIGEAPGKAEDKSGEPFMGRSGKVLNELLKSINLNREDVFIANIVKCRPPKNRDPKKSEITACIPYLEEQIKNINPKIIVPLGRHAMNYFLKKEIISEAHGKIFKTDNKKQTIIPIYHPAASMYDPKKKPDLIFDFQTIKKTLKTL